jgi:hypothetical protein
MRNTEYASAVQRVTSPAGARVCSRATSRATSRGGLLWCVVVVTVRPAPAARTELARLRRYRLRRPWAPASPCTPPPRALRPRALPDRRHRRLILRARARRMSAAPRRERHGPRVFRPDVARAARTASWCGHQDRWWHRGTRARPCSLFVLLQCVYARVGPAVRSVLRLGSRCSFPWVIPFDRTLCLQPGSRCTWP